MGTFGDGLYRLTPSTGEATPVDLGSVLVVSSVYEDRQGTLWVGTLGDGLLQVGAGGDPPVVYEAVDDDPTSLAGDSVVDIMQDRQGVLWIATYSGLDHFDRARGTVTRLRSDSQNPTSLASNDVLSVLIARNGTLYVGTDRSVDVSTDQASFRSFPLVAATGARAGTRALTQTQDATVWAGTEAGLHRILPSGPEPVALTAVPNGTPIQALLEDQQGRFFAGTLGGGLVLYDRESRQSVAYTHDPGDPAALVNDNVISLEEDERGNVWVGTEEGLCRLDRAADTARFTCLRPAPDDPNALADGLVQALHARDDGSLWVGTRGGLHRVDTEAPERGVERFTETEDLPSNDVRAIVEDDDGYLWLATSRGLARFDPVTKAFQQRTLGGEGAARTLGEAATRGPDGTLYFGGSNGLLAFSPRQLSALNSNPPQVVITEVLLGNEPIVPGDNSPMALPAPLAERITLSHDQDYLVFRFAGLHFSDSEQNRYKFTMEGLNEDGDWIEAGRKREATYTNLSPGRYTFRVQASNADGVWSPEGASMEVAISPPWWRTLWAYLAYAVIAVMGFVAFDRFQRARLLAQERQRAERREQEIRAETAEAQTREAEADRQRAEAEARAARADADRQRAEAEGKRELEKAFRELKATQNQLVQSEKLASLGQLTAGIAHEIKNPLNFVNNFADLSVELADELGEELHENKDKPVSAVLDDVDAILDDLRENSRRIHQHGTRADRIVKAMLLHSRGSSAERARVEANRFVEEYANLAYHGARANDKDFQVDFQQEWDPEAGEAEVIPQELGRVLINLLSNAFYAVGQRRKVEDGEYTPTVTISTNRTREGDEDWIEVRVEDNGTGIPEELSQKVFEPFFTTKPTGEGTGLGLSLAYDIVTQGHGGQMSVESEDGVGTAFSIRLPARPAS